MYIKNLNKIYIVLKFYDLFLLQTVRAVAPSSLVHRPVNASIHQNGAMEQ